MTRAAGILGSDGAAEKMRRRLRNKGIELERRNIRYLDELLDLLQDNPDIEAVLIVERGLRAENPVLTAALEAIRTAYPVVRIIFIMDAPERNYEFEMWCYERGIYDVFYPGRDTDVNIDAIGDAILMGYIDRGNTPPPPADPNALPPDSDERPGLLDRFKGISLPEIKLPEFGLPGLSDFTRKRREERPSAQFTPSVPRGITKIGVINTSHGFGATSLTVNMANYIFSAGYSVAVLAMDLSPDLLFSGLSENGVTVSSPSGDESPDWQSLAEGHDYLIIDFGVIYEYLPSGAYLPAQSRIEEARAVQDALEFCDLHIYLVSEEPWHIKKATAFVGDEKGFVTTVHEADASYILQSLEVL